MAWARIEINHRSVFGTEEKDEWPFDPNGMMMDVQTAHASKWDAPSGYVKPSDWVNEWYFNEAVPINTEQAFSINYLIQSAR